MNTFSKQTEIDNLHKITWKDNKKMFVKTEIKKKHVCCCYCVYLVREVVYFWVWDRKIDYVRGYNLYMTGKLKLWQKSWNYDRKVETMPENLKLWQESWNSDRKAETLTGKLKLWQKSWNSDRKAETETGPRNRN